MAEAQDGRRTERLLALDILRGLAVAGMILVVSPGSWTHRLWALDHAPWNGYRPADLVFPAFLFAVGAAMALKPPTAGQGLRVLRRVGLLILLGLVLNFLVEPDPSTFRIPGILQRIALAYLVAAAVLMAAARGGEAGRFPLKAAVVAAVALTLGWAATLAFTAAPGFAPGDLSPAGTLAAWVDRSVFGTSHLWAYGVDERGAVVYDPEGLLATFPAAANVLIGAIATHLVGRAPEGRRLLLAGLAAAGLIVAGHALDFAQVINKRIWTAAFVLVSSGWALALYVLFMLVRGRFLKTVTWPLRVLGANAILAFTLSQVLGVFGATPIGGSTPQAFGFGLAQALVPDPYAASLLCALAIIALITAVIAPLNQRGLYLRL
jgi:predicted acyltransferase